jgi:activator of 2-hydroxyglutaryl-CoA dehydratase
VEAFKRTGHDVVVLYPRGGGGTKRCYSYLKSQGVPEEKFTILKDGVADNPCIVQMIREKLANVQVVVPESPSIIEAMGAAIEAARQDGQAA